MNNIWLTTRNNDVQVSDLQNVAYLRVCGPVASMLDAKETKQTDAKDFIAHGYGGSDG